MPRIDDPIIQCEEREREIERKEVKQRLTHFGSDGNTYEVGNHVL